MHSRLKLSIAALVIFAIGWFTHAYVHSLSDADQTKFTQLVRESSTNYRFTKPLLLIFNASVTFPELDPLKNKLSSYIEKVQNEGKLEDASVYFRDMNTTEWTGINEDELYDPASMLKVALLIAYLHVAEKDPSILKKQVYYYGDTDKDSYYKANHTLVKGRNYSVQELLVDMIVKSGNDSTAVLFNTIDQKHLAAVYDDLTLPYPKENSPELLSPRTYSRLFRVLYDSTYLDQDISEQVLDLLSQTEFDKGLRAELTTNTAVAHKFGERTTLLENGKTLRQLHDCGIVYYPDHPYFLCVMTKGKNFSDLEKVIADISKITYDYWKTVQK
jgi:beta-lactamase class A